MTTARTMKLAQQLYEGVDLGRQGRVGLITYMRTDSTRISDEAADAASEFIYENYGKEYLPPPRPREAVQKKPKGNVQDAHEAIRPTDLKITPKEARKSLDKELADLYELIWSRFVASQMAAAIFDQTTVEIVGGPFTFRATGRITRFKGWMQVYADDEEGEKPAAKGKGAPVDEDADLERALPEGTRKGDPLTLASIETRQSFTKPPARYTESLLVKEMEAKGIGRPSTYSAIISTIQDRGYVEQRERRLHATELGMNVCDALVGSFPALFDVKFTAKMEGDLDTIAGGKATYLKVMQGFYKPLQSALGSAGVLRQEPAPRSLGPGEQRETPQRGASRPKGTKSDILCDKCGSPMELRLGNYGHYLACLGFPACRNIISATEDGKPRARGEAARGALGAAKGATPAAEPTGEVCDKCGSPMVKRKGRSGGEFFGCSNYPTCNATRPVPLGITCPACSQGDIVERVGGRFNNVFYGCTRYPECRFTSSMKPVNQACARCKNPWVVQAWTKEDGEFLECPKCKHRHNAKA
jgi:DNA topoisomerase-1